VLEKEGRVVISSLVVETAPDYTQIAAARLLDFTGVEVHGTDGYKIIVTIEAETVDESHDLANDISLLQGVLNVNLVYLNFEDDKTIYPDGV
jgi:nitrate reductase NapD